MPGEIYPLTLSFICGSCSAGTGSTFGNAGNTIGLFTLKPQMRKTMADNVDWLMILEKCVVTNLFTSDSDYPELSCESLF